MRVDGLSIGQSGAGRNKGRAFPGHFVKPLVVKIICEDVWIY